MEKTIIILSGVSEGKTRFAELTMNSGYWTWQINTRNSASKAAEILGCDVQDRNELYHKSLNRLISFANEEWNFEENYILRRIDKFKDDDRVVVLIIHGLNNKDFIAELQEEEAANTIHIVDKEPSDGILASYDYVLNCQDSGFEEMVARMMRVFTNNTIGKQENIQNTENNTVENTKENE